ncbi:divalent-cation tolerance protein CutA [Candidatus Micrarchaeota archaeon]|nr:divalent-cation tolerance protein CutA [Candidatus Micrarchaeota archaeon]
MLTVYVTCSSQRAAEHIGEAVVKQRLAACVNVIPSCVSFFFWKEKFCKESETILILKTTEKNYSRLEKTIKQMHSYENPCIVAFKWEKCSREYGKWVEANSKREVKEIVLKRS